MRNWVMRNYRGKLLALGLVALHCASRTSAAEAGWSPAPAPLMTRWSTNVSPKNVHPEYPRPRLVRKDWLNLNGLWDYAITGPATNYPDKFDGKILVPFPVEAPLSGTGQVLNFTNRLWYRRTFAVPREWRNQRVWLRFGALDWESTVWINGALMGTHRGGFDGFGYDITPALKPDGDQEIRIFVCDRVSASVQVVGKQRRIPQDTFYSRISGIWQTVWLEPVPAAHVADVTVIPRVDQKAVEFITELQGDATNSTVEIEVSADGKKVQSGNAIAVYSTNHNAMVARVTVPLPDMKLWSPSAPFLYDARVRLVQGKAVDEVGTYFGMRRVSMGKDSRDRWQLLLNGQPTFHLGVLDEGYWPDGLYTAPTDEALRWDIETIKRLGFNTVRKHVKVDSERWYYWCDKLGLLVWQDMPNGQMGGANDQPRSSDAAAQFELELDRMIKGRFSHPCIVGWVLFNQGWAQYHTAQLTTRIKELDPTRLVISASGWNDFKTGDINSKHLYPMPEKLETDPTRALFLGEFGGFGVTVPDHKWTDHVWSHYPVPDINLLPQEYEKAMRQVIAFRETTGLAGAVFTQLTDVEQELTGLLTYDRSRFKMDTNFIIKINQAVLAGKDKP